MKLMRSSNQIFLVTVNWCKVLIPTGGTQCKFTLRKTSRVFSIVHLRPYFLQIATEQWTKTRRPAKYHVFGVKFTHF